MEDKECLYKITDYLYKSDFVLYRKKHPNCKYCKYYHWGGPPAYLSVSVGSWYECALSDKVIKWPKKAKFCKYYKVKEGVNYVKFQE